MNYKLKTTSDVEDVQQPIWTAFVKIAKLLGFEKKNIIISLIAILVNSGMTLLGPLVVGYTIDRYIENKDFHGVLVFAGILLVIYLIALAASYVQTSVMGAVGQRTLFRLRNSVFTKLQELPVAFFNENKAGDLISRINNDTQRLNSFFSQTLMQFTGSAFTIVGAGIFILAINWRLGLAALIPAALLMVLTRVTSNWIKKINLRDARAEGALSSEIQESLENFKVILAFNRRDYFKEKFNTANVLNFRTSVIAGIGNNIFSPTYDFASNIAQLIVLIYGIYLIAQGHLAIGLLVSFLLYIGRFYDPLRQFASFWSTLQIALSGWERISEITNLESNLKVMPAETMHKAAINMARSRSIIRFEHVSFSYPKEENASDPEKPKQVLHDVSFNFEKGKTYALVGPTGGGKTTTASLAARLFDPTEGVIYLDGRDIRTYTPSERTKKIGFILQEPYLFSGTVRENILYGNEELGDIGSAELTDILKKDGLEKLLERFDGGLDMKIDGNTDSLSLGQKQLIAFMRAVLRSPELLILDEATANIDTVTEQLLGEILRKLPAETTKVVIAHRLNTIENADEIFFVNGATITLAGSMEQAVDMLLHNKRKS